MSAPTPLSAPSPTPEPRAAELPPPGARRRRLPPAVGAIVMFVVGALGVGLVAGVLWRAIVKLPMYRIDDANRAIISERGLATIFAIDAWYAGLGFVAGLLLGAAAWKFFRPWGWRMVLLGFSTALLAALVCWLVGTALGPGPLQVRLAEAAVGDYVPVDFQLHAMPAIAVWPFGAMAVTMVLGTLSRDPDWRRDAAAEQSAPDGGDGGA